MSELQLLRAVEMRVTERAAIDFGLEVHGRAERTASGGIRAVLELRSPPELVIGTRTIDTDESSCHALDEALPIVVAMMLNVPREELTLSLPSRPAAEGTPPPTETPSPSSTFHAGAEISIQTFAQVGILPDVAPGFRIASMTLIDHDSAIGLDVAFAPEVVHAYGAEQVVFRLLSVGVSTCALGGLVESWLRLEACAGIRVDALWAEPQGFDENRPTLAWIVEPELGGRIAFLLASPAWLMIGLSGSVPIPQPVFAYRTPSREIVELHRVAPVAGRLDIGLALRFE
jgi:hypothetical protein